MDSLYDPPLDSFVPNLMLSDNSVVESTTTSLLSSSSSLFSSLFQLSNETLSNSTAMFSSTSTISPTIPTTINPIIMNMNQTIPPYTVQQQMIAILTGLFYGTAFILGAIGNGLIIYIVSHYSRMRSLCNVFLASLATADLLLVCVCIPVKLVQLMTYTWTLGNVTCKLLHYVQNVCAFCSVLTLTTMSIERYYAILHPVECRTTFSMHHIQKIIFVIWMLALVMSVPAIYLYILVPVGEEDSHYWCVKMSEHWTNSTALGVKWTEWRQFYELYMFGTILILPALIMSYTYCRICTHLWTIVHRRTAIRYGNACHVVTTTITTNGNATSEQATTNTKNTKISLATPEITTKADQVNYGPTANAPTKTASSASTNSTSTSTSSSSSSTTKLHQQRTMEEDNQTVKQVIKMLVAVVVLFVLCWAPMLVINLLKGFHLVDQTNEGILKEVVTVTYLLAYLNSVLNPFIYGFMSKNFRLHFKLVLHQCWILLLGPSGRAGVYGSTKSDQSKQTVHGTRLGSNPGLLIRMDQFDLGPVKPRKNCPRKPSEPKTEEEISVVMVDNNNAVQNGSNDTTWDNPGSSVLVLVNGQTDDLTKVTEHNPKPINPIQLDSNANQIESQTNQTVLGDPIELSNQGKLIY